jgi:hypothetical protein
MDEALAFEYLKTTNAGRTPNAVVRTLSRGMAELESYVRELAKVNDAEVTTTQVTGKVGAITPETENTCHYVWNHAHDSKPITEATTDALFRQIRTAFRQDWEVFELQQANRDDYPVIDTIQDAGAIAARRIIARIAAERGAAESMAAE